VIVTITDFGANGPYLGQMEVAIRRLAPAVPVVHLVADAPMFDPISAGYLLAALVEELPPDTVVLAVVDPGVGGARLPLILRVDDLWLVGPDNGLFEPLIRRAGRVRGWQIVWRPDRLAPTFHGRDLFAPVAARLALGLGAEAAGGREIDPPRRPDLPDDYCRIIYIDAYGNAWSGLRAAGVPETARLTLAGLTIGHAARFEAVAPGAPFWYANSSGLVEIAVHRGRADHLPGLTLGLPVAWASLSVEV
jgi:S-adenosylmethionine hydrolase